MDDDSISDSRGDESTAGGSNKESAPQDSASQLLDGFDHDVRSPLANVKLAGDLLEAGGKRLSEDRLVELAAILSTETDRLRWMIDVLVTWHAFEFGRCRLERDWHTADELVGAAVARTSAMVDAVDVKARTEVRIGPEVVLVHGDAGHLEMVLTALLDVAFGLEPAPDQVEVQVRFDRRRADFRLLLPFAALPGAEQDGAQSCLRECLGRTNAPAAELSLALVRQVVAAHGGQLTQDRLSSSSQCAVMFDVHPGDDAPPPLSAEVCPGNSGSDSR